jgi:hypothetical protein
MSGHPRSRRIRALARHLLLEHGSAFAAGTPDVPATAEVDDAVATLLQRYHPTLSRATDAIVEKIAAESDSDVARQMNDHHGTILTAYGDTGYFFGLCTGLEMASLILDKALTARTTPPGAPRSRKGGQR